MIKKLEINGVHKEVDQRLKKYTLKKIGKLDIYIPRHARESAHAEVKLIESKAKDKNQCTCEVILHLPNEVMTIKETTVNMYAAVDIVEAKLKNQLKKYKGKHSIKLHRRALSKLKHTFRSEDRASMQEILFNSFADRRRDASRVGKRLRRQGK